MIMENRSNNVEPSLSEIDESAIQIEECLKIQLKPAAYWLKHINYLRNEVDNTISVILSPDHEKTNRTLYGQISKLSVELPSFNKSLSSKPVPDKPDSGSLPPTIVQLQELASKAQKEIYKLKSQIQKEIPATKLK